MEVAQSISDRRVVSPPKDELNYLNPPLEPSVRSVFELLDQTLPVEMEGVTNEYGVVLLMVETL